MVPLDNKKKLVHDSSSSSSPPPPPPPPSPSFYQTAFPKLFKFTACILSLNHEIRVSSEVDNALQ
jgi:hypothetical protein